MPRWGSHTPVETCPWFFSAQVVGAHPAPVADSPPCSCVSTEIAVTLSGIMAVSCCTQAPFDQKLQSVQKGLMLVNTQLVSRERAGCESMLHQLHEHIFILLWLRLEKCSIVQILESEGSMQSKINQAEGDKAEIILTSEAAKMDAINRATGASRLRVLKPSLNRGSRQPSDIEA